MKLTSEQMRLYAVTDRAWAADDDAFFRQIEAAIDGGASIVQLREKQLEDAHFLEEATRFVALCRQKGVVSIINDNVEIAVQTGADGVHVGQEDLEAGRARALLGHGKLIGVSAHTVEEARRAVAAGCDYLGTGAAFVSDTKSEAKPISHDTIRAITAAVEVPVVAIGGITRENIRELGGCGLSGVAVVSALFGQRDVREAAAELKHLSEEICQK
ncbi:thiamine phosphate synthase [Oscillibacter sp.]|uniref:thiamine phosphate synthase n=1 Tax=Oscillibacter sp. TaxID=1945593 RepID=UPI0026032686|nr:thiamine phosphate synthase [Oscillibacter sp.]MDD3346128.1 thiamine phosphate synthase [Oscillibacter sp.]